MRIFPMVRTGVKACLVWLLALMVAGPGSAADLKEGEWYVRLIATAPGNLQDKGNVLGQLENASLDYDVNDLEELEPFAAPFLTIVFPHPEWGIWTSDFTSDYHPVSGDQPDEWVFEVRSDVARQVTLSWQGKQAPLRRMQLVDLADGTVTSALEDGALQSYTLNMKGTTHQLKWVLLERSPCEDLSASIALLDSQKKFALIRTEYGCVGCGGVVELSGKLNGIAVENGQIVQVRYGSKTRARVRRGKLESLTAPEFNLVAQCKDKNGYETTATAKLTPEPYARNWRWQ